MYFEPNAIKIIGIGGIGTQLLPPLMRWNQHEKKLPITLIDGDHIEVKNLKRQDFLEELIGQNKAEAAKITYKSYGFDIHSIAEFLDDSNVDIHIEEGNIIFTGVDNYKTRVIIQEKAKSLNNILCIFMGNEYTDGDVLIYLKSMGEELTDPVFVNHPELIERMDKLPHEMSCEELLNSAPQIIFTNLTAATFGLNALYNFMRGMIVKPEFYFDIEQMAGRGSQTGLTDKGKKFIEKGKANGKTNNH